MRNEPDCPHSTWTPHRPAPVRLANFLGPRVPGLGPGSPRLDEESVVRAAERRTGLSAEGEEGFRPGLRRLLTFTSAWITEQIGIHAIFGAFMAGAIVPRRAEIQQEIHERLEQAVVTVLLPVFFVVVGLSTRVDLLDSIYLWAITALVIATAIAGKWGGSMLAARVMGEPWRDAAAIGILMNTRGLTELVMLSVGLELGVITPTIFTIMALMALVTTLMSTPMLALISPSYHRGMTSREVPAEQMAADADK